MSDHCHKATDDLELTFIAAEDSPPLVTEGTYQVMYVRHEKRKYYSQTKLYVLFEIIVGPFLGTKLIRSYNFYDKLPRGSDLFKDFAVLSGHRISSKSRLSMSLFKNRVLKVSVRTVKQDRKQNPLPAGRQYSKVDAILEVIAGGSESCAP